MKYVNHSSIVVLYMVYFVIALIFEIFLVLLSLLALYITIAYQYKPGITIFICMVILLCLIVLTIRILRDVYKNKWKAQTSC